MTNVYPFADPARNRQPTWLTLDPDSMAKAQVQVSTLGQPAVFIRGGAIDAVLRLTDEQVDVDGHVLADFLIRLGQQVRDQLNDWEGELQRLQDGGAD